MFVTYFQHFHSFLGVFPLSSLPFSIPSITGIVKLSSAVWPEDFLSFILFTEKFEMLSKISIIYMYRNWSRWLACATCVGGYKLTFFSFFYIHCWISTMGIPRKVILMGPDKLFLQRETVDMDCQGSTKYSLAGNQDDLIMNWLRDMPSIYITCGTCGSVNQIVGSSWIRKHLLME